jgi:hypothetical protein
MEGVLYRGRQSVIRLTPKTTQAKILRSLTSKGDMFPRMAAKNLKNRGAAATGEAVAAEMKRIYNRRKSSIGYNKSGWAPAARGFGASRIKPAVTGSVASEGKYKQATNRQLEAFALNAVGENLKEGKVRKETYGAVQRAVNAQTKDMVEYLNKRLLKLNKKYGGKI